MIVLKVYTREKRERQSKRKEKKEKKKGGSARGKSEFLETVKKKAKEKNVGR